MSQWIWKSANWPNFTWDSAQVQPLLSEARFLQGKLLGILQSFSEDTREQLNLQAMTEEMITTSAIEGSIIDRDSVRSSIYHRLGIGTAGLSGKPDRYVEGLLDIMLDATDNFDMPLNLDRLCRWHAALFPTGYSGLRKIIVGELRGEGEMKIISGRGHKITIHYIAPPYQTLKNELDLFFNWFNVTSVKEEKMDGIIRAAIAHLWYERIHPFDDGNGRIGRAIVDMALSQDEKLSTRFYSISSVMMEHRKDYYHVLDTVSVGEMDVTVWVEWFLNCFINAIKNTMSNIDISIKKSRFWQVHADTPLNERQKKVLNKMLNEGVGGYIGGMTTRKYIGITKVSRATAFRELKDLIEKNCIQPLPEKGRSTAYEIVWPAILEWKAL